MNLFIKNGSSQSEYILRVLSNLIFFGGGGGTAGDELSHLKGKITFKIQTWLIYMDKISRK